MKKLEMLIVSLLVVGTYVFAAPEVPQEVRIIPAREWEVAPDAMLVPPTAIMIAAQRKTDSIVWVSGAIYRNGDIIKSTNNQSRLYWQSRYTTNRYTAATCPSHHHDTVTYDTNLRWTRIPPYIRNGINIINASDSNDVWLGLGDNAFVNQGIRLKAGQAWWIDGTSYQGGVWAISYASTNLVLIQEY